MGAALFWACVFPDKELCCPEAYRHVLNLPKKESTMSSDLHKGQCQACANGIHILTEEVITSRLLEIPGWRVEASALLRDFHFKNFYETMAFVNAVAWVADRENHHPDMEVGYNHCLLRYSTHAVGGITENDFICAQQVNGLLQ